MTIRNYATRTQALTALEGMGPGESILLAPYNPGAYQQESSSLKAVACKKGITVELKKVLMVSEGEIPQQFLRVKLGGEVEPDQRNPREQLRDEAADLLEQAEQSLQALLESYSDEQNDKFSACHPRSGLANSLKTLADLRKAMKSARV